MNSASCSLQETNHPLLRAHNLSKTEFNMQALISRDDVGSQTHTFT